MNLLVIFPNKKRWCTDQNGEVPVPNDGCFPSDTSIEFVPLEYAPEECPGRRPEDYPQFEVAGDMTMLLGYNEPNRYLKRYYYIFLN